MYNIIIEIYYFILNNLYLIVSQVTIKITFEIIYKCLKQIFSRDKGAYRYESEKQSTCTVHR